METRLDEVGQVWANSRRQSLHWLAARPVSFYTYEIAPAAQSAFE
jgi:hypothetical protein